MNTLVHPRPLLSRFPGACCRGDGMQKIKHRKKNPVAPAWLTPGSVLATELVRLAITLLK